MKITCASTEKVNQLESWIDDILERMNFESAFVTDKSTFGDFMIDNFDIREWSEEFNYPELSSKTFLWEVAEILKRRSK